MQIFFSQIEPIYFLLPIAGFIVGLFGSMLGGGGGFFFLPLLVLLIGVPAQTAVITSLVATLPICIVGILGHSQNKNIDFHTGIFFSIAGVIGAFTGAGITNILSQEQLKASFGIYSVLIAIYIMRDTNNMPPMDDNEQTNSNKPGFKKKVKGSFFGLSGGVITGTFGASGTAPILAGLLSLQIPLKRVIGTSLFVVLTNTIFAVGAHLLVAKIDLTVVLFLTIGSVVGALLGPNILSKINTAPSENKFRYVYAVVMVGLGILMITG